MKPVHNLATAMAYFNMSRAISCFEYMTSIGAVDIYIDRDDCDDYFILYRDTGDGHYSYVWILNRQMTDDYIPGKFRNSRSGIGPDAEDVFNFISTHFKLLQ